MALVDTAVALPKDAPVPANKGVLSVGLGGVPSTELLPGEAPVLAPGVTAGRVAEGRPTFQADLSGRTFWPDLQAGTRPERPLIKDVIRLLNNIISRLYTITVN